MEENLILQGLTLGLGVSTQLEVLSSLNGDLVVLLASVALHLQHDLLGGLGLLVEHRLGLTTKTRLLSIITSLTLSPKTFLALLVLGDLLGSVLLASLAEGVALLRDINLRV